MFPSLHDNLSLFNWEFLRICKDLNCEALAFRLRLLKLATRIAQMDAKSLEYLLLGCAPGISLTYLVWFLLAHNDNYVAVSGVFCLFFMIFLAIIYDNFQASCNLLTAYYMSVEPFIFGFLSGP